MGICWPSISMDSEVLPSLYETLVRVEIQLMFRELSLYVLNHGFRPAMFDANQVMSSAWTLLRGHC